MAKNPSHRVYDRRWKEFGLQLSREFRANQDPPDPGDLAQATTGRIPCRDLARMDPLPGCSPVLLVVEPVGPRVQPEATIPEPAPERLMIIRGAVGLLYVDRGRERRGDYVKMAFLPYRSLELEWTPGRHPRILRALVQEDARSMQARRGQWYNTTACGQPVLLGGPA